MALGYYKLTVPPECNGQTVRTFLRKHFGLSARSMTLLKKEGMGITREHELLYAKDIIHEGEIITLSLPEDQNDIVPVPGELNILFEDEYLLIVNKPANMPVHPTKIHQLDTLANILSYYQSSRGERYTFRALNRLDKDTSGIVIIAKDRIAYSLVQPTVQKTYIAVCEGELSEDGVIDLPITLESGSKIKRCFREDGAEAVTHYHPVEHGNGHTMCEVWLETGRTHQIRCHMSHIGHPLAGDDLYGGRLALIGRQALHCQTVELVHPVSKKTISIQTDIPSAFYDIIKHRPE